MPAEKEDRWYDTSHPNSRSAESSHADQEVLGEIAERLDLALEAGRLGLWDWKVDTGEVIYNERWVGMLGYSLADIDPTVDSWKDRIHPDDRDDVERALQAHFDGEAEYYESEHRMETKAGDWKWVRDLGKVVERDDDGDPIRAIGIQQDITDRKQREETLRRQRDRMETFFESAGNVMLVLDLDGRVERINNRGCEILGYTKDELIGTDWCETVVHGGEETFGEVRRRVETAEDTGFAGHEHRVETRDGRLRTIRWQTTFLTDGSGEPTELLCSGRDITERKERQKELEEQNARLEHFASRLSHELRNPLSVIRTRLELARESVDIDHFDHLERAITRMERLIDDMLTLSRDRDIETQTEPLSLPDVVDDCWETIRTPETDLSVETSVTIAADHERLCQVLQNLFRNAVEHTGPSVVVTVGDLPDGFYVEDDGPGIPPEKRETYMQPRTSSLRHGTGLGLYIVEAIADAHDWELTLTESEAGGLRFEFRNVETL